MLSRKRKENTGGCEVHGKYLADTPNIMLQLSLQHPGQIIRSEYSQISSGTLGIVKTTAMLILNIPKD